MTALYPGADGIRPGLPLPAAHTAAACGTIAEASK
jgi:hypothetical protein